MVDIEVAAYLDRRLPADDRANVEAHLAACRECRQEVLETQSLLARARRPRRIAVVAGWIGAAAMLTIFVLPTPRPEGPGEGSEAVRGPDNARTLVGLGPIDDAAAAGLMFVWREAAGATTYRITLTGRDGVPLWTAATSDTSLALPDSVRVLSGTTYFWIADALMDDGTTRSTGLVGFRVAR